MQPQNSNTAHSLYALYETLPDEVQQGFLQELLEKQSEKLETLALYLACKEVKDQHEFLTEDETKAFISCNNI
ncbi:hypothetical protein [Methylomicrobium lacus]|uniref:hypothetical protein n=1 Tax=Methylomicrobium lacus TaxID=136992 RepID=UPI00045E994C|nr:hypothetical protein [Methylomicrobium lacus]